MIYWPTGCILTPSSQWLNIFVASWKFKRIGLGWYSAVTITIATNFFCSTLQKPCFLQPGSFWTYLVRINFKNKTIHTLVMVSYMVATAAMCQSQGEGADHQCHQALCPPPVGKDTMTNMDRMGVSNQQSNRYRTSSDLLSHAPLRYTYFTFQNLRCEFQYFYRAYCLFSNKLLGSFF